MKNNIKKILQELYEIDSSLQNNEGELEKVIMKMLKIQPDVPVDANFKKELHHQIQEKILQKKVAMYGKKKLSFFQILSYIFGMVGIACFGFIIFKENLNLSLQVIPASRSETNLEETKMRTYQDQEMKTEVGDINMMADVAPSTESGLMKSSPMMAEYIQEVYVYSFTGELNLDLNTSYQTFKKLSPNSTSFSEEKLPLEHNTENILKVALKGGKDGFLEMPSSEKKKEVSIVLKNPKIAYTNVYHYAQGVSQEYFAPSVIFEVEKNENTNFYQTEIVVPLVQEIYKYDENGIIIGLSQE